MSTNAVPVSKNVFLGVKTASISFGFVATIVFLYCSVVVGVLKVLFADQGEGSIFYGIQIIKLEVTVLYMTVFLTTIVLLSPAFLLFASQKFFEKQMAERDELVKRSPIARRIEPLAQRYRGKMLTFLLPLRETRIGSISFVITVVLFATVLFYGLNCLGISFAPMPIPHAIHR